MNVTCFDVAGSQKTTFSLLKVVLLFKTNEGSSSMALQKQRGLSTLGLLVAILVVGFVVMLGMKTSPYYLDDYAVGKVLNSLSNRSDIKEASRSEVREWIQKGLSTNRIDLSRDELKITRDRKDGVSVDINYERRVHLMYNIDLVLTFKHYWNAESQ